MINDGLGVTWHSGTQTMLALAIPQTNPWFLGLTLESVGTADDLRLHEFSMAACATAATPPPQAESTRIVSIPPNIPLFSQSSPIPLP